MSEADLQKWDERYRAGAYAERTHPTELLRRHLGGIPRGRALDVACGAGRNALFLAESGVEVDAVDISQVALARANELAVARNLRVNWIRGDLAGGVVPLVPENRRYSLILMIRYVDLPLIAELISLLDDDGVLIVEEHLQADVPVAGPTNPAFRLAPNALLDAARDLRVLLYREGLVRDPDGGNAALAQLIACRGAASLPLLQTDAP